jgi:peptide deformylase
MMAIRNIRKDGDEVLRKKSREIEVINDRLIELLKDMEDTMYSADGVGLAAPQVGILKRVAVVDAGNGLIELINPVIIEKTGEQTYIEGCLSVPDVFGEVKRPEKVKVETLDRKGKKVLVEGEGLQAVALCHEIDHLDGILFKDKASRLLNKEELEKEMEAEKKKNKEKA